MVGELVAEIDRVFRAAMAYCRDNGGRDVVIAHGGPAAVGSLVEFRTSLGWPGRVVTWPQFAAVTRYRGDEVRGLVDGNAAAGMLAVDDGGFRATDRGHAFLAAVRDQQGAALGGHWADVGVLAGLCGRVLVEAARTGGDAFAAMAPPFEPAGTPPGLRLLDRLGTLRYHRADAWAASWGEAGYTAATIAALPPGPAHAEVEAAADARSAPPFSVLRADELSTLLGCLRALD